MPSAGSWRELEYRQCSEPYLLRAVLLRRAGWVYEPSWRDL